MSRIEVSRDEIVLRIIGIGAAAIIAACVALIGTSARVAFGGMATPTAPPVILFEDDFATYSRRWTESESPKASALYTEEMFTISIGSPGVSLWSIPDFDTPLHDYRIEVTAQVQTSSEDAQFGLIMDHDDEDHFYAVLITLDGTWQFLHYEDGVWLDLTPPETSLPDDTVAELSSVAMRLQVDVTNGNTVTFSLNDQHLDTITLDDALTGSVFGLIARAEHGFIEVAFDDVLVSRVIKENE
jgi:hypothetical protein